MMLALKQLRNLGWAALVFFVAILLYPLSLGVAALRSDLKQTEAQIVSVKRQLRYLETEFAARSSMQQLELWNDLEYGYVAPDAMQFLAGEKTLAHLGDRGASEKVALAQVDVPAPGGNDVLENTFQPADNVSVGAVGEAGDLKADRAAFVAEVARNAKGKVPEAKTDDVQRRARLAAGLDQKLSRDVGVNAGKEDQ